MQINQTYTFDYYPFGMLMPGRSYSSTAYKYGFNGKEKDDEVKGSGNSINYDARFMDTRLARWFSVDPNADYYPSFSPYVSVVNNPIVYIDKDGEDPWAVVAGLVGAGIEWGSQITANYIAAKMNGKQIGFKEAAWDNIDFVDVGISGMQAGATHGASLSKQIWWTIGGNIVKAGVNGTFSGISTPKTGGEFLFNFGVGTLFDGLGGYGASKLFTSTTRSAIRATERSLGKAMSKSKTVISKELSKSYASKAASLSTKLSVQKTLSKTVGSGTSKPIQNIVEQTINFGANTTDNTSGKIAYPDDDVDSKNGVTRTYVNGTQISIQKGDKTFYNQKGENGNYTDVFLDRKTK